MNDAYVTVIEMFLYNLDNNYAIYK